jgi:hypothetical protein
MVVLFIVLWVLIFAPLALAPFLLAGDTDGLTGPARHSAAAALDQPRETARRARSASAGARPGGMSQPLTELPARRNEALHWATALVNVFPKRTSQSLRASAVSGLVDRGGEALGQ